MHDLALPSSGRASGNGDACLLGLSLCSGGIARTGVMGNDQRKTRAEAYFLARLENKAVGPASDRGLAG